MKESNRWRLEITANAWEAIDKVQSGVTLDLLLLDLPVGDAEGLRILHWLRRLRPALPIVLISYPDDVDRKQESIRMGTRDYLVRPIADRQLEMVIQHNLSAAYEAAETEIASDDVEPVSDGNFFIGISPIMRKLRTQAALLSITAYKIEQYHMAASDSIVLPPGKGPRSTAGGLSDNGPTEWTQIGK